MCVLTHPRQNVVFHTLESIARSQDSRVVRTIGSEMVASVSQGSKEACTSGDFSVGVVVFSGQLTVDGLWP